MRERLRRLHVEERVFTWRADIRAARGADGRRHRFIRVRVWGVGKNSCVLQADLVEVPDPATPEEETYAYPSAAIVRRLVSWGLAAGWTPDRIGGRFLAGPAARPAAGPAAGPVLPGLAVIEPVP